MVDLSKVQGLQTQQDQVTRNRPQTIYVPDQPDAPKVQVVANIRDRMSDANASADAIRQVLGLANKTLGSFNENVSARQEVQNKADAAQGVADQVSGTVDPELEQRSLAYSSAIGMANARDAAIKTDQQVRQDAKDYLASNPDATLDDLNAHMEKEFRSLVLGQDGKPVDFGHPEANAFLYRSLQQTRAEVLAKATDTIQLQMRGKAASAYDDQMAADVHDGKPANVEGYLQGLGSVGIDLKTAKQRLMSTVGVIARQNQNAQVLMDAADSRRPDGTPSFSPTERAQLLEQYHDLHDRFELEKDRAAREASAHTMGDYALSFMDGGTLNPEQVRQQVATGQLRSEDVHALVALKASFDEQKRAQLNAQRADIEFGRSNQRWAWDQEAHARTQRDQNDRNTLFNIFGQAYRAGVEPGDVKRSLIDLKSRGQISDQAFAQGMQEAGNMAPRAEVVQKAGAHDYEYALNEQLETAAAKLRGRPATKTTPAIPGATPAQIAAFNQHRDRATYVFYQGLRQGKPPAQALNDAGLTLGLPKTSVDVLVTRAKSLASTNKPTDPDQQK